LIGLALVRSKEKYSTNPNKSGTERQPGTAKEGKNNFLAIQDKSLEKSAFSFRPLREPRLGHENRAMRWVIWGEAASKLPPVKLSVVFFYVSRRKRSEELRC
jgi:hypothetical protein